MAQRIQTVIPYGALRRSLFVNDNNKDDYGRHRGQVLYGMALTVVNTHVIGVTPGAVYTAQGLRIYLDATDGQVDLAAIVPDAFNPTYQQSNLPLCVMVYLSYTFSADQVAQSVNVTSYADSAGLFTLSARIVPFDMNTGAPVYNLAPLDPIYLDVAQPGGYTALINYNGPAVSYPSALNPATQSIQFGEIPLGYIMIGVDPTPSTGGTPPTGLTSLGVSIISYDNAFSMISDAVGQDILLPVQPNDVTFTLVSTPTGTAQYQGYSAKTLTNGLVVPTLVRPFYGTPNPVDGSHIDSNWATYRQPNFLKDGTNVFEALRRMDVVLRQWLDFTGNQSLVSITQDSGATLASGTLPLQASVDAILAVFDGGTVAATNANLVVWPTVTTGLDTGTPTNRTIKGGLIPHVENTLLLKLTQNGAREGDSTRSAIAALDTAIFVTLTAALGVSATRAQLRDPTTSALTVNLTSPTLASPTMTGTPTAPNASPDTGSSQVATTGYLAYILANAPTIVSPSLVTAPTATPIAGGAVSRIATATDLAAYAPLASPTLTGNPQSLFTPGPSDYSNTLATTIFVANAVTNNSPRIAVAQYPPTSIVYIPIPRAMVVTITGVAGGGGGAGDNSGSGAAGAGVSNLVVVLAMGDEIAVTVGSGGAGNLGSGAAGTNTLIQVYSGGTHLTGGELIIDAVLEGGQGGLSNVSSPNALGGRVLFNKVVPGGGTYPTAATAYYSNDGLNGSPTVATNTCPTFGPWSTGQNGTASLNSAPTTMIGGGSIFGITVPLRTFVPGSGGNGGPNLITGNPGGDGLVIVTFTG